MSDVWPAKTLGEVLQRTESIDPTDRPDAEFEYVDVSSVSNETFEITETQRLRGKDAPSRARRLIRTGDVLFATIRPTLRRIAMVPPRLDGQVCSTGYFVMRPKGEVDRRWLFYWLFTEEFTRQMAALQKGAAYPAVNDAEVRAQRIPVPPLAEQRRIVAILDEAVAAIAIAKANTEQNLANARAVFESGVDLEFDRLQTEFPGRPLSEWVDDISTGPFGSLLHKSDYVEGGIPLVNPINIEGDKIVPDPRKAVSKKTAAGLSRYALREGDVVTARRGEIGRCAVIEPEQAGWLCGTGSFFIRPGKAIDPYFLTHLLRSAPYRTKLEGASARATMPSISNDDLNDLVVHVPPLAGQRQTEAKFRAIAAETERLESLAQQKLAALDALKASLLHHAFTGQLTSSRVNEVVS